MASLLDLLSTLLSWVDEIELDPSEAGRFANKAARKFHKKLAENSATLLQNICGPHSAELKHYIDASFGDATRLDFGTGHETTFFVFLFCLEQATLISHADYAPLALIVFPAYLRVTRALQQRFTLEPAGSRGVWGLDDFSFLPFVFGSAQLLNNARVEPDFMMKQAMIDDYRDEFLYVDAVGYIKDYKTGAFHEHSPTLWDITGARGGWKKINQGMLKMYKGEVMNKFPVMQHTLFGSLFPFPETKEDEQVHDGAKIANDAVNEVNGEAPVPPNMDVEN